jgi:hypothetical protein
MEPYKYGAEVTPNDSADLPLAMPRGIYVGGAGNIVVTLKAMKDGQKVTMSGVVAGSIYPIEAKRIWVAGTTATGIVALY